MPKTRRKNPDPRRNQPVPGSFALNVFFQERPPHLSFRAAIAPLLAFVAVFSYSRIWSLDLWWHLATGEWVWRHRAVPMTDPFSFTAAGQPWIAHEWLFGVIAFLVQQAAGLTGLAVMKSLLATGLLAVAAWTARTRGASAAMTALVLAAAYAVARDRFSERPELLSLPIAMAFLLVYEKSRQKQRLLLLLPALELLWANVHGGTALLGWGLAGAFLIDRAWQLRAQGSAWRRIPFHAGCSRHFLTLLAVIAVSFANPGTYRTLVYGLLRVESPLDIQEFMSLGARMKLGIDLTTALFLACAAATVVLFVLRPRAVQVYEWLLLLALLILAGYFFRFRPLFVFLLAPALAWQLSRGKWLGRLRWWLPALASLALLGRVAAIERNSYLFRFGPGIHAGVLPVEAAEFIRGSGLAGRMFNSYGFGGYFIWKLGPGTKVFIDGREDVYVKPGVAAEYAGCFRSVASWRALVARYGIDYAVVGYPDQPPPTPESSLDAIAFPRSGWALVYFDDVAAIYVRRDGKNNQEVIRRNEVKFVQPLQLSGYLDAVIRDPAAQRRFLEEMSANLGEHPESFRAHFLLGMFFTKQGQDLARAIREFELSAAINPEYVPALLNLGNIYASLGRFAEARQAYGRVLRIEDNATAAQQLRLMERAR